MESEILRTHDNPLAARAKVKQPNVVDEACSVLGCPREAKIRRHRGIEIEPVCRSHYILEYGYHKGEKYARATT